MKPRRNFNLTFATAPTAADNNQWHLAAAEVLDNWRLVSQRTLRTALEIISTASPASGILKLSIEDDDELFDATLQTLLVPDEVHLANMQHGLHAIQQSRAAQAKSK